MRNSNETADNGSRPTRAIDNEPDETVGKPSEPAQLLLTQPTDMSDEAWANVTLKATTSLQRALEDERRADAETERLAREGCGVFTWCTVKNGSEHHLFHASDSVDAANGWECWAEADAGRVQLLGTGRAGVKLHLWHAERQLSSEVDSYDAIVVAGALGACEEGPLGDLLDAVAYNGSMPS